MEPATSESHATAALPYHEPGISTVLIQASLLVALNISNSVIDRLAYCGLLGQIALGIAWGTPGAKWLDDTFETAIMQLGYMGLILIVYEGGLSTSLPALKANLWLSLGVALTGIALPIGLSFALSALVNATSLQCFAAGAALCSTSLGTTFTLLRSSGLAHTRLGIILTSAAMIDDVIGLVMVQVISSLGESSSSSGTGLSATDILRPVLVSLGLAVFAPAVCAWVVKPVTLWINAYREKPEAPPLLNKVMDRPETVVVLHTLVLLGAVAGAGYAGTSVLYAAYIAGACITWWDTEVVHYEPKAPGRAQQEESETIERLGGIGTYEMYYAGAVNRVLRPFFFASIGFSIPITEMFSGSIVWKGAVYSVLMILAKLVCGLWLIRLPLPHFVPHLSKTLKNAAAFLRKKAMFFSSCLSTRAPKPDTSPAGQEIPADAPTQTSPAQINQVRDQLTFTATETQPSKRQNAETKHKHTSPAGPRPISIYPASLLGCGMVARGEIGFLISSLAESQGIFDSAHATDAEESRPSSQIFLVVTWAVVLCTIVGPLVVGILAQRVRRLQENTGAIDRARDGRDGIGGVVDCSPQSGVLGVWGVH